MADTARSTEVPEEPTLVVEVAVLGDTNAQDDDHDLDYRPGIPFHEADFRGGRFFYEGLVYPEGTLPADRSFFEIDTAVPIGSYFDTGHALLNPQRREPHLLSTQTFVLGGILGAPGRPFVGDHIVVHGFEHGDDDEGQTYVSAVIGGTGQYAGARGVVVQQPWGHNSTTIANIPIPAEVPAPNFRYAFHLID